MEDGRVCSELLRQLALSDHRAEVNVITMDETLEDDDDDAESVMCRHVGDDDEDMRLTRGGSPPPSLNLILVMNMNLKVVLCDCGKAYKLPEELLGRACVEEDETASSASTAVLYEDEDEQQDKTTTQLVAFKDGKERY